MPWASFLFSLGTFLLAVSVTIATKPIPENGDSEQMITNFWIFFIAALVFMVGAMFLGWRAEKNNNNKYERLITTMTEQHKTLIDAINNLGNWMWQSLKDIEKDSKQNTCPKCGLPTLTYNKFAKKFECINKYCPKREPPSTSEFINDNLRP